MQGEQLFSFGPYRIDPAAGQLWRGTQEVKLTPKALAVLRLLLARPGQVVTKEELLQSVWAGTAVSDAALTSCIQELRQVLRDDARKPRYLETVHRRGFRFIAPLTAAPPISSAKFKVPRSDTQDSALRTQHSVLVGRETELAQLHQWLEKALHGERQLVFVTGEPGIGKTTLVEAFVEQVTTEGAAWIGRGQCIEHYGASEAYLSLLEALGRLCRAPEGKPIVDLLARHAPTWLVQMPALVRPAALETLHRKVAGATKERMLRELAEALEALTSERPLILWLEDLHWGDYSTLDWLAFVARRQEGARLLVVGTYRPVEVLLRDHPLKAVKQELQLHGRCQELALDFLSEGAVTEYLARRFEVGAVRESPLRRVAKLIHQRTDGNPLFMVNLVDHLLSQGVLVQVDGQWVLQGGEAEVVGKVPGDLRQMIEQQLAQVEATEQVVLEVASVAGAEFSAAAVAAGGEAAVEAVEERCEELARRKLFLRTCGTDDWPDGTVATRYGFLHALYQQVLYERLPAGRRQRLHQRIGEREEKGHGTRAREIAAELAVHFERGRDYHRAVQYLQQAGENAIRRSANQEAIELLTRGLELLKRMPDTPERAQQELELQLTLGIPSMATKGYAAPEVEHVYARTRELCQQLGESPQLFRTLMGLSTFYLIRGELQTARELGEQCLRHAQSGSNSPRVLWAHMGLGQTLFYLGEFALAHEHVAQGIALYDPQKHNPFVSRALQDPKVSCLSFAARALWMLGYPDQALKRNQQALTLAQELSHFFSLAYALYNAVVLHQFRREQPAAQERVEALLAIAREQGFPQYLAQGTLWRGWALAEQGQGEEGVAQLRQGIAAYRATGSGLGPPHYLALLADVHRKAERVEEGSSALAEALAQVDETGERFYEAELYRLKGELSLQSGQVKDKPNTSQDQSEVRSPEAEAEECFRKAIEIARKQQAKSLELRSVMSLSRLWRRQGKTAEARQLLAEIYGWFTEGFDTADLKEAKALLEKLS